MKKGDIAVLILLLLTVGLTSFALTDTNEYANLSCVIKVDGEIYKEIKLGSNYNNFIEINSPFGYNKISIKGNTVKIVESDCEDGLCLKEKEISKPFESIICLPQRTVVYIKGESDLDYVSY